MQNAKWKLEEEAGAAGGSLAIRVALRHPTGSITSTP